MEALFLIRIVLEPHVDGKPPPLTLGLDILIDLHGAAGDAAGAGADQNGRHLLALLEGVAGVGLKDMEALPSQFGLDHTARSSFARISSSRARAASGVIFAWTSPSTVITGARPHAPRQATVSRVKRPSAEVFFRPARPR